jgi:hypothetical protein
MSSYLERTFPLPRECGHRCGASIYGPYEQAKCCRCIAAVDWFRLDQRTATFHDGRTVTFVERAMEAGWNLPGIDAQHLGWHAGLRRPAVYANQGGFGPAVPVRTQDGYGIVSGRGFDERYFLCTYCRESVRAIPAWLFWHARGWTPGQARHIALQEEQTVRVSRRGALLGGDLPEDLLPWSGRWSKKDRQDTRHAGQRRGDTLSDAACARREFKFSIDSECSLKRNIPVSVARPKRSQEFWNRFWVF